MFSPSIFDVFSPLLNTNFYLEKKTLAHKIKYKTCLDILVEFLF